MERNDSLLMNWIPFMFISLPMLTKNSIHIYDYSYKYVIWFFLRSFHLIYVFHGICQSIILNVFIIQAIFGYFIFQFDRYLACNQLLFKTIALTQWWERKSNDENIVANDIMYRYPVDCNIFKEIQQKKRGYTLIHQEPITWYECELWIQYKNHAKTKNSILLRFPYFVFFFIFCVAPWCTTAILQ